MVGFRDGRPPIRIKFTALKPDHYDVQYYNIIHTARIYSAVDDDRNRNNL